MKNLLESHSKSRYTFSLAYRKKAEAIGKKYRDRYSLAEPKKVEVTCLIKHFQDTFSADKKNFFKLMKALKKVQTDLKQKCRLSTKYAACKLASSHFTLEGRLVAHFLILKKVI